MRKMHVKKGKHACHLLSIPVFLSALSLPVQEIILPGCSVNEALHFSSQLLPNPTHAGMAQEIRCDCHLASDLQAITAALGCFNLP